MAFTRGSAPRRTGSPRRWRQTGRGGIRTALMPAQRHPAIGGVATDRIGSGRVHRRIAMVGRRRTTRPESQAVWSMMHGARSSVLAVAGLACLVSIMTSTGATAQDLPELYGIRL